MAFNRGGVPLFNDSNSSQGEGKGQSGRADHGQCKIKVLYFICN